MGQQNTFAILLYVYIKGLYFIKIICHYKSLVFTNYSCNNIEMVSDKQVLNKVLTLNTVKL